MISRMSAIPKPGKPLSRGAIHRRHRHPVLRLLRYFHTGSLSLTLPDGNTIFHDGYKPGVRAILHIRDWKALDHIAASRDIGFGKAYMMGLWDSPNLKALMRFLADNIDEIEAAAGGRIYKTFYPLKNRLRINTPGGSRRNTSAHYELGNDFFRLWLDESLTYSCALFGGDENRSLEEAQRAKYRRILTRLNPVPQQHILDIGCGWGGFMEEAAGYGCHVTGITLSPAQAALARLRLKRAGLDGVTQVRLQDYRQIAGTYDHVVSIGTIEHIGEKFWPHYMRTIHDVLKPDGKALIQSIVIRDELFSSYRAGSDFIREYIFPGGHLPSLSRLKAIARQAGLQVEETARYGNDYALTLEKWLEAFDRRATEIGRLGYEESFIRKWRLYLAGAAAMFHARRTDLLQIVLRRPVRSH